MTQDHTHAGAPGHLMAAEISEQPQVLDRIASTDVEPLTAIVRHLHGHQTRAVLLAARGTSDHAALYAKYLIETQLGLPVGLVSTSTFTGYGTRPDLTGVVWICVSQSGGSPDLVESTAAARSGGALTIALTNTPSSPLQDAVQLHLPMLAGPELSVAATKTYTASLMRLWQLVTAWAGADLAPGRLVSDVAAAALDLPEVAQVASRYRFVDRMVTTSRGFAYPTAREAALKLMETCYLSAHAFSGADLLHGPFAMIDEDRPVVVIVPPGAGGRMLDPVLDRLAERGADVCLVGAIGTRHAEVRIPLQDGLPEQLAPIVQIIPLQQLALQLALSRHYDPDRPRGLRKVTETT